MKTGNTDFIYKNDFDKACFQRDMAYGESKDLVRRTESDKVLRDEAFEIASNPSYDGYQRGLASMVYKFFDKKSAGKDVAVNSVPNLQMNFIDLLLESLTEEKFILHLKTIFGVQIWLI